MKRDMDLIRDILLYSEENTEPLRFVVISSKTFDKAESIDQVIAHIRMLEDQGFVDNKSKVIGQVRLGDLTWNGHDLLDSIRDPEIWKQTKQAAQDAGGWTVGLIGEIAKGLIRTKIKEHTGVEI